MNTGIVIILLILFYWLFGYVLDSTGACQELYKRMGNSDTLWFFLLGCGIVLMWL